MIFVACGDTGYLKKETIELGQVIKECKANFGLLLGDNFYPGGLKDTDDPQFEQKFLKIFPFIHWFVILGNHDYILNPKAQIQITQENPNIHWKMPHYFYDSIFKIKNETLHIIFIDTCILGRDLTSRLLMNTPSLLQYHHIHQTQYTTHIQWLTKVLSESTSKWKIVCGHYPIYSNGPHQTSLQLGSILLPLLQQYKVDCYISGHDHNLQHIEQHGIHFLISGSLSDSYKPEIRYPQSFRSHEHGFLKFKIEDDDHLHFEFVNAQSQILHQFSLTKKK